MYLVKDIGGAIGLMAAALVLLGTWPVVLAVLERRGRLPQHTYLDYSITNFLAAVLIALTFGQIGGDTPETPNFLAQLTRPQDYWPSIMFALAGGVVITLGTVATQYGWAYVGLSVTEVMASSLKVVIGTTLNYFLDGRINRAEVLFPGVGCFLIAACLGSLVHSSNAADNQEKLSNSRNYSAGNTAKEDLTQHLLQEGPKDCEEAKPALPNNKTLEKAEAGTADFLIDLEDKRSIKVLGSNTLVGLAIVTFAGVCYSLFARRRSTWRPTTSGTRCATACRTWWSTRPTSTSASPPWLSAWRSTFGASTAPWPACRGRRCGRTSPTRRGGGWRCWRGWCPGWATRSRSWPGRRPGTRRRTPCRPCRW
uniref:Uncharacterized protein n=1 Tax=Aegilops tauschii subsp. strangulata TaxID=200361 RepID=A0A453T0A0_AEGTS